MLIKNYKHFHMDISLFDSIVNDNNTKFKPNELQSNITMKDLLIGDALDSQSNININEKEFTTKFNEQYPQI